MHLHSIALAAQAAREKLINMHILTPRTPASHFPLSFSFASPAAPASSHPVPAAEQARAPNGVQPPPDLRFGHLSPAPSPTLCRLPVKTHPELAPLYALPAAAQAAQPRRLTHDAILQLRAGTEVEVEGVPEARPFFVSACESGSPSRIEVKLLTHAFSSELELFAGPSGGQENLHSGPHVYMVQSPPAKLSLPACEAAPPQRQMSAAFTRVPSVRNLIPEAHLHRGRGNPLVLTAQDGRLRLRIHLERGRLRGKFETPVIVDGVDAASAFLLWALLLDMGTLEEMKQLDRDCRSRGWPASALDLTVPTVRNAVDAVRRSFRDPKLILAARYYSTQVMTSKMSGWMIPGSQSSQDGGMRQPAPEQTSNAAAGNSAADRSGAAAMPAGAGAKKRVRFADEPLEAQDRARKTARGANADSARPDTTKEEAAAILQLLRQHALTAGGA